MQSNLRRSERLNWTYDQYGNRWEQTVTSGSGPQPSYTFNANNRSTTGGVTAAGNMTADGLGNGYTFDAENRMVSITGTNAMSVIYDALGHRVERYLN